MSTSPSTNVQPQVNSTLNIPPDPGNSFQNPLTGTTNFSSNSHSITNPQNHNLNQTRITFRHVLRYYWRGVNHNIAYPTPPQIWLAQNVYPLVTPMRVLCFIVSLISFMLACCFFMETELYKTHLSGGHNHASLVVFSVIVVHFLCVFFLLFFSFFTSAYERFKNHSFLKSIGEFIVMRVMSLLISGIEQKHQDGSSDVAEWLTCVFLTIDSLCIIILLKPGHNYSLLDAMLTLTLHLGLEGEGMFAFTADAFVFVMMTIKNFLWLHIANMHGSDQEQLQLVWYDSHHIDHFSSV
ncbi:hypothetical protein LR48_Vigan03g214900 [Vigna angularis]|uniref:Transmembrane protein n=1 Tax=Phaseolus angularis TaxID=3914 RepID=A0A0L9U7Z6_PHAAN|nr:hypothetical protein LR48_Vigan03g214900 [Vigna angularis]